MQQQVRVALDQPGHQRQCLGSAIALGAAGASTLAAGPAASIRSPADAHRPALVQRLAVEDARRLQEPWRGGGHRGLGSRRRGDGGSDEDRQQQRCNAWDQRHDGISITRVVRCDAMRTADVVIMGGGCMGAARGLLPAGLGAGRRRAGGARGQLGTGSTGRNAGGVRHQFSDRGEYALSRESIALFERFEDEVGTRSTSGRTATCSCSRAGERRGRSRPASSAARPRRRRAVAVRRRRGDDDTRARRGGVIAPRRSAPPTVSPTPTA